MKIKLFQKQSTEIARSYVKLFGFKFQSSQKDDVIFCTVVALLVFVSYLVMRTAFRGYPIGSMIPEFPPRFQPYFRFPTVLFHRIPFLGTSSS